MNNRPTNDLLEENDNITKYKHKVVGFDHEFYLLKRSKKIEKFKEELKELFSAQLVENDDGVLIEAIFPRTDPKNHKSEFDQWLYHLKAFVDNSITKFMANENSQYRIDIPTREMFVYLRYKAIYYYSDSDTISLIYRDEPNYWIRIDGESELIEIEKKKLEQDIAFFKENNSKIII